MKPETPWKVAFFATLAVFEITRELLVVQTNQPPTFAVMKSVSTTGDFTAAEGQWVRTDGGTKLVPSVTRIECNRAERTCREIGVNAITTSVGPPDTEVFPAAFRDNFIEYTKDYDCVRYLVRIDTRLERVEEVRERKRSENTLCNGLEQRIESRLDDSWNADEEPLKGHFVPILAAFRALF
jgi:hypothetical protein